MSINGSFHTSGASIARGRPPRQIEQKPEPAIRRGTACTKAFLREEGGTRSVTEGACATSCFHLLYRNALSLSRLTAPAPSRREPFAKPLPTEKHHQRNFLGGASYFSAKNAEMRVFSFLYPECLLENRRKRGIRGRYFKIIETIWPEYRSNQRNSPNMEKNG